MRFYRDNSGFTLVELGVSMIIIGLLVAGVLKGQDIVDNARISSTIAKVRIYDTAATNFYGLFDEYPGDMTLANTKIPLCGQVGCTYGTAANDGDNDGRIEGISDAAAADNSNEGRGFWEHLAAADLASDTLVGPGDANVWDVSHPSSPFSGGFTVMYNPTFNDGALGRGHYFRLSRNQAGAGTASTSLLKPRTAQAFDRKLDDQNPASGRVLAIGGETCFAGAAYSIGAAGLNCDLLFKFR